MTHDASHSYTYDAENRIIAVDGGATASFVYDGDGYRVQKNTPSLQLNYVRDMNGTVMAEVSGPTTYNYLTGYVYLGGMAVAQYANSTNTTNFIHTDHLGSTRLVTGYPTPSVVECDDYYPFGESISCGGTSTTTHKFTGYERDAESGLDNAQARYNSSSLGRFMSPDPLGNFVADATNPQTWNLYAYVNNNPLAFVDPTGTDGVTPSGPDTCPPGTPQNRICVVTRVPTHEVPKDAPVGEEWSLELDAFLDGAENFADGLWLSDIDWSDAGGRRFRQRPQAPGKVCTGRGFGLGLSLGANGDLGVVKAGAGLTGSVGGGLFDNSGAGFSGGAFRSGGALAYAGSHISGSPAQDSSGSVFGAFAGAGVSIFATNAGSVQQLSGPFSTLNFNAALGLAQLQISYAKAGGTWVLSASGPRMGGGIGLSVTTLNTGTVTTKSGCH